MSACEKCWRDSRLLDNYHDFLVARSRENPCTAEEQAGPDAGQCPVCERFTLHQFTSEPMCGCQEEKL